ncbi:MAG: serine/threonine protein kinase [Sandaracinus sp.]|nr:serine/threonine protein kinase [Sandaracinus sp.]
MATLSLAPEDTLPEVAPEARERQDVAGRVFGPYVLIRELATGGMGAVYLAREEREGGITRHVALKKIHDHLAKDTAFVTMFLDEARIASRIHHPHVCTVFEYGKVEGTYFIAMEYIRGLPMSELLHELGKESPESSPERLSLGVRLLIQACEGLHAAHELRDERGQSLQVVHRDVSPHNLFLSLDGTLRVLDFGIARAADRLAETTHGRVKGKFAYMAPEQALGKEVDRRSDVFALGVVLWELLTLQRLFKRDAPAETILALVNQPVAPPSSIAPDVPPELDGIALKALARDPAERYATARDLARALERTLRSGTAAADVADWLERLFPEGASTERHGDEAEMSGLQVPSRVLARLAETEAELPKPGATRRLLVAAGVLALAIAAFGAYQMLRAEEPQVLAPVALPLPDPEPLPAPPSEPVVAPPVAAEPAETADPPAEAPTPRVRPRGRRRLPRIQTAPLAQTAAPRAMGEVRLSGPSELWGARVTVRGRQVATIPGSVELPAGTHELRVERAGAPALVRRVTVREGAVERVVVRP